jgi:hypothetical protein
MAIKSNSLLKFGIKRKYSNVDFFKKLKTSTNGRPLLFSGYINCIVYRYWLISLSSTQDESLEVKPSHYSNSCLMLAEYAVGIRTFIDY